MLGKSYPGGLSTKQQIPNIKLGNKPKAIVGSDRKTLRAIQQMITEALATSDKAEAKRWIMNAHYNLGNIRL